MPLDHTEALLRLSNVQLELRAVRTNLVRTISAEGDRDLATKVKQYLTSADRYITWIGWRLQPPKKDDSGIPEREALQL